MHVLDYLSVLSRLDHLIRTRATGTSGDLAKKFNVSKRMIYHYLNELRAMGAEISYDHKKRHYHYTNRFSMFNALKNSL